MCRLARPAIHIGTPFVRLLCLFVAVWPSVSCKFFASLIGWRCWCRNEWPRVPFVIITNVSFTVSGVFVCWSVRVVAACSPFTSTHSGKIFLLLLSLARCTSFARNAARPTLFAVAALPPLWSYCAGRALNPIVCVCLFSRAAGLYVLRRPCRSFGQASVPLFLLTLQSYNLYL